jgi:hypothetical protein
VVSAPCPGLQRPASAYLTRRNGSAAGRTASRERHFAYSASLMISIEGIQGYTRFARCAGRTPDTVNEASSSAAWWGRPALQVCDEDMTAPHDPAHDPVHDLA